ncbi:FAD-dependent oxidoreductase [Microbispora sp. NPDC046933]|uniref:NAD(P)/FAD-dependent oxidoreductase n=1 Tax=Microbispora sp. NPDC046933 TaxID=3155618 RepID=UPI0033CAE24C
MRDAQNIPGLAPAAPVFRENLDECRRAHIGMTVNSTGCGAASTVGRHSCRSVAHATCGSCRVYALGSHGAGRAVPGAAEHAFDIAARPSALRLRERLDSLDGRGEGGRVVVVGDGLTGIETATEIAESRPGLSVALVARGELGARLSAGARSHLRQACDRLGITVLEHTSVEAVEATRVPCADGTALASGATVWTAGFAVTPIAAAGGLEVTGTGQIVVDRTMRSVSHPNVYAIGDSAYAIGDSGRPLPMSCASAGYTGRQAVEAIVGRLTGRKIANTRLVYTYNHISLGRQDGILQMVDDEGHAKPKYVGGRKAARVRRASSRCRCGPPRTRPSACPSASATWPPRRMRPPRRPVVSRRPASAASTTSAIRKSRRASGP